MAKTFEDLLQILTAEGFEIVSIFDGSGTYVVLSGDPEDTRPIATFRDERWWLSGHGPPPA